MRVFKEEQLEELYCNKCCRKIEVENQIIREGVFSVDYQWGYFSSKDGKKHKFDLCEKCYDEMIKAFKFPVEETIENELL